MGYESRLYVAEHFKESDYMNIIASFDLCKMGGYFPAIFKIKISSPVWLGVGEEVTKDLYGDTIKYAPIEDVAQYLENHCREMNYRRIKPCIALLRSFKPKEWGDLVVLHYGH